jgi:hypothetical protein
MVVISCWLDLQLPMQLVPITTKVVSSNSTHGIVHSIDFVIVCQWLATGQWFSLGASVSSTNETDCQVITEILLKVALNTITLTSHNRHLPFKYYVKLQKNSQAMTNYIENESRLHYRSTGKRLIRIKID